MIAFRVELKGFVEDFSHVEANVVLCTIQMVGHGTEGVVQQRMRHQVSTAKYDLRLKCHRLVIHQVRFADFSRQTAAATIVTVEREWYINLVIARLLVHYHFLCSEPLHIS